MGVTTQEVRLAVTRTQSETCLRISNANLAIDDPSRAIPAVYVSRPCPVQPKATKNRKFQACYRPALKQAQNQDAIHSVTPFARVANAKGVFCALHKNSLDRQSLNFYIR